eukprot:3629808-Alexandrium_andersonii.AAC.1
MPHALGPETWGEHPMRGAARPRRAWASGHFAMASPPSKATLEPARSPGARLRHGREGHEPPRRPFP